ncbi:YbcC family protein [Actinosynnema sp. CS-041913]|uniref:YbcC family protein n=1 Tax=Actinosynnema sp. CS-041913 TaxID=3239917 RepID=UPI003D8B8D17
MTITDLVDRAAELLPEQGPLQAFVHHNTLHAFEHLPFADAVTHAAAVFGAEPYQSEAAFHGFLRSGRITPDDLDAVVAAEVADDGVPVVPGGPTPRRFHETRLRHHIEVPRGPALHWLLAETDAVDAVDPRWDLLRAAAPKPAAPPPGSHNRMANAANLIGTRKPGTQPGDRMVNAANLIGVPKPGTRPRDRIVAVTGVDPDHLVHPLLIRLTAAFLDQGVASWAMPERDRGLLAAFRALYRRAGGPPDPFLRGLSACLREQDGWEAEQTIRWALAELGVPEDDRGGVITATLLSLRGWAGMVRQFELRPDRAPVEPRPARLADYLAVQLTLDVFAARHVSATAGPVPDAAPPPGLELVYEAFVLARLMAVPLTDHAQAAAWLAVVDGCDEVERRRLLHLAYERRHRIGVLDGLAAHQRVAAPAGTPSFQAVFCLDEREESVRRHLEECCPSVETFGYAGFFGVAMNYRGVDDVRSRPLCPVVITPRHAVVEQPVHAARRPRRLRARWTRAVSVGSRTLARGGVASVVLGVTGLASLVGRCLFPRAAHRWSHRPGPAAPTRLVLGFPVAERTEIVASVLRTTGLSRGLAPVVLVVGHGSSSLNNPHESAHDCGATGGGRGGPNARAFAAMANDPAVRSGLAERGIAIPDGTWFVGGYHNTCDDSMTYYDEDLVPAGLAEPLRAAKDALAEACVLAAHERCRRFASAPADLAHEDALAHAETHAVDLGQPRPEYGHATNAVCVVGRRALTRGLFLDRRAFLASYEPAADTDGSVLASLLAAVGPVCAGINLEYYFSFVDPTGYGCGTKLPHNITGLIGVMDGHASDLRTGLPWQMVEIHEPVRLLVVVEAGPERLSAIVAANPTLERLVSGGWIGLVAWDVERDAMHVFQDGAFQPHVPERTAFPVVTRSVEVYAGFRDHLGCAHVLAGADVPAPVR